MTALVLSVLTALFFGRVAGQALVAFAGVTWLPPMEAWFSGYLPYPVLLPIQVLILGVMATIDWQVWRGSGLFARARPRAGRVLRGFAGVYALAMVARFVVTGGAHVIPIVFHWVLAAYLFTLGRYWHGGPEMAPQTPQRSSRPGKAVARLDASALRERRR